MTREEAVKMLKSMMDGNTNTSYEWAETIRMAIEALEQEPCEDCISRKSLIAKAHHESESMGEPFHKTFGLLVEFIAEKEPSIQPVRPKGKWIDDCEKFYCSECRAEYDEIYETHSYTYYSKFCPNCGADMRGGEK